MILMEILQILMEILQMMVVVAVMEILVNARTLVKLILLLYGKGFLNFQNMLLKKKSFTHSVG
tara:strand:+ start:99 stop:287 length:189 start_codon:yes stop_codon:yes gene_type:complete